MASAAGCAPAALHPTGTPADTAFFAPYTARARAAVTSPLRCVQSDVGVDPGEFSRNLMRNARKVSESDSAVPEQQLEPVRILEEAYEQTKTIIGVPALLPHTLRPTDCTSRCSARSAAAHLRTCVEHWWCVQGRARRASSA